METVTIEDSESALNFGHNISSAFAGCPIKTLYLGRNILYSALPPFKNNTTLRNLTIGKWVTEIGSSAFNGCSSLLSVTIPDNVTQIGDYAFVGCSGMTSLTISNNVAAINQCTFQNCSSLTSVIIPNSVTSIGTAAFSGCQALTAIAIPNRVTEIGSSAFYGCDHLTSVAIPYGVMEIGTSAFVGCRALTSITIPGSVDTIGGSAFDCCDKLETVVFEDGENTLRFNVSYPLNVFDASPIKTLYLGRNISYDSGGSPFQGKSSLIDLTFGNKVTKISYSSFSYCIGLKSLTIPKSVTEIERYAFNGCDNINEITSLNPIPPTIYSNTFDGIDKVTCNLYVPKGSLESYCSDEYWKEFQKIKEDDATGINNIKTADKGCNFRIENGRIIIAGGSKQPVEIYNIDGTLCYRTTQADGEVVFSPQRCGIYVIKCGIYAAKAVVK